MESDKPTENIATTIEEECHYSAVDLRTVPYRLKQHIINQSIKRMLTESEILSECIEYHKEHAET